MKTYETSERRRAMKALWALPKSHSFRALYPDSYPIWLVEKEYEKQVKHYQSVYHFIAALEMWKKEEPKLESYLKGSLYLPLQLVERFLSLAHWFSKHLKCLTDNNR